MIDTESNFIHHLVELRKRLIFSILGILIIFLCLLPFSNQIYQILANPLGKFLPGHAELIATDITSPFFIPMKLTALLAFVISLPHTLFQIWQFIAPGLYHGERRLIASVIISSFILFILGVVFCYFLVLPAIFHFVGQFKAPEITMLTDISNYLNFVLSLFIVFGLAFEMPVIVFIIIRFGILSIDKARKIRSYMFVGCFIIAAIVTPPDILSQTMLALPLYLLYELGIIAAQIFKVPSAELTS